MHLTRLLTVVVPVVIASSCLPDSVAKADAPGWQNAEIPMPPKEAHVSYHRHDFAQGFFEVVLAKGGPTGYFVWAHLRGRNPGGLGSQHYAVSPCIIGDANYPYYLGPVQTLTLGGKGDKHRYGVFKMSGETLADLKLAIENGIPIKALAAGERNHEDFTKISGEAASKAFKAYLETQLKQPDALEALRSLGKGPKK